MDELQGRIVRIYAAVDATRKGDLNKFRPSTGVAGRLVNVEQDFRGGRNDEQLSNLAYSAIHNIANLLDHFRRCAKQGGHDADKVDLVLKQTFELQVIIDLANVDKHGYPPRNGGYSGRAPKLVEINRVLSLSTGTQANSSATYFMGAPNAQASGSGSAKVVVTGTIIDCDGKVIGDLRGCILVDECLVRSEPSFAA